MTTVMLAMTTTPLTAIHDFIITSWGSWKRSFWGQSIITPTLDWNLCKRSLKPVQKNTWRLFKKSLETCAKQVLFSCVFCGLVCLCFCLLRHWVAASSKIGPSRKVGLDLKEVYHWLSLVKVTCDFHKTNH